MSYIGSDKLYMKKIFLAPKCHLNLEPFSLFLYLTFLYGHLFLHNIKQSTDTRHRQIVFDADAEQLCQSFDLCCPSSSKQRSLERNMGWQ